MTGKVRARNRRELIETHGSQTGIVISCIESIVNSVSADTLVKNSVKLSGNKLIIKDVGGHKTEIRLQGRIVVVGAGKAAGMLFSGVNRLLGPRIKDAALTIPRGSTLQTPGNVHLTLATHPIPGNSGLRGTKRIFRTLDNAAVEDLIIVLISGGGSALMPYPAENVSLWDKQQITGKLLSQGATISEINTVRKHLSAVKGGQLLRYVPKGATVLGLIISDVLDDDMSNVASGPTLPDASTFKDAALILKKYKLSVPNSVSKRLQLGIMGKVSETPKPGDPLFQHVHNVLIGNNSLACDAAIKYLTSRGIEAKYIGSRCDGEARILGEAVARSAAHIRQEKINTALVAGGETTVNLGKWHHSKGGRNQEAALAFALNMPRSSNIIGAFIGTDGIDGNSPSAGGVVSRRTLELAEQKGIDLAAMLSRHQSHRALSLTHSALQTGLTGTNVNDITVVFSPSIKNSRND